MKFNKLYVEETVDADFRLGHHNGHFFKWTYIKAAVDWEQSLKFECAIKQDALYLEKFIKKMKSRRFIEKVINYPVILADI